MSWRRDHFIKQPIEFHDKLNVFVGICFFHHFLREFFDVPELIIGDHGGNPLQLVYTPREFRRPYRHLLKF